MSFDENLLTAGLVTDKRGLLYSPVMKWAGKTVEASTAELASPGYHPFHFVSDEGVFCSYVTGTNTIPSKITKLNKRTLELVKTSAAMTNRMYCCTVYKGAVYGMDASTRIITKLDAGTLELIKMSAALPGSLSYCSNSIPIDDGILYLRDTTNKKIIGVDCETLTKVGETPAQAGPPADFCVYGKSIYYADNSFNKVYMFDKKTLAKTGESAMQEGYATAVLGFSDTLYYADISTNRIITFDTETLEQTGKSAALPGRIYYLSGRGDILFCNLVVSSKLFAFDRETLEEIGESEESGKWLNHFPYGEFLYCVQTVDGNDVVKTLQLSKFEIKGYERE